MSLRDDWKETGKSLGGAFSSLGKSIVKSAKKGIDKVDSWANGEEKEESKSENDDK